MQVKHNQNKNNFKSQVIELIDEIKAFVQMLDLVIVVMSIK